MQKGKKKYTIRRKKKYYVIDCVISNPYPTEGKKIIMFLLDTNPFEMRSGIIDVSSVLLLRIRTNRLEYRIDVRQFCYDLIGIATLVTIQRAVVDRCVATNGLT